jgi:two-component system OmpR family response regulator
MELAMSDAIRGLHPTGPASGPGPVTARVLVVDDEDNITDVLCTLLRHVGYEVASAATGREALSLCATFAPDLVLLDVMLPDLDGFEVCRRLRSGGLTTPVLFLTARDAVADKVGGLELGADDYVTKPFSLEEVVARVKALLRRSRPPEDADGRLRYADLEMDEARHQVWRSGRLVELSPTEFRLLRYLLLNAEIVVSKVQILDSVWEYGFGGESTAVETYISYLRRKVDAEGPPLIRTVRGVGYTLRVSGQ